MSDLESDMGGCVRNNGRLFEFLRTLQRLFEFLGAWVRTVLVVRRVLAERDLNGQFGADEDAGVGVVNGDPARADLARFGVVRRLIADGAGWCVFEVGAGEHDGDEVPWAVAGVFEVVAPHVLALVTVAEFVAGESGGVGGAVEEGDGAAEFEPHVTHGWLAPCRSRAAAGRSSSCRLLA